MQTRRRFLGTLTAALLAALMIGNGSALAQGKGKKPPKDDGGGGGGIVTVQPPMRYWINSFSMPADHNGQGGLSYQMTSSGVVIGDYLDLNGARQPYVYDPSIDPDSAVNLNAFGIVGIPEGWRISQRPI